MMGSATALLTGVTQQGSAPAGQGDAGATDIAGFQSALDAMPTHGSAPAEKVAQPATRRHGEPDPEAAPPDMAAVLAAMLQAALPTAASAAAARAASGQSDSVAAANGDGQSGAAAGTAAGKTLLANLRAADLTAPVATDEQGVAPATADGAASANQLADAAPNSGSGPSLRQLLQMLTQAQSGATQADAGIDKPGIKQAQSVGQSPAATAASIALTGTAPEVAAAAPIVATPQLDLSHTTSQQPLPAASGTPTADATLASANLATPAHQAQAAVPAPDPALHTVVGTPRWADELGAHVALMSLRGQHEGSLNLTPEHLGPLEVRVSVNQNTANVWFGAQHADTRAALAEAMPRLRELLAGAGLMLGQSGVSQQAPRQGAREGAATRIDAASGASAVEALDSTTRAAAHRIAIGLVDTYA